MELWSSKSFINEPYYASTGRQECNQQYQEWNDYVGVFLRDDMHLSEASDRMIFHYGDFDNGYLHGSDQLFNPQQFPEDKRILFELIQAIHAKNQSI